MTSESVATIRDALIAHVPDGYDQVETGWSGPLLREALESLARVEYAAERGGLAPFYCLCDDSPCSCGCIYSRVMEWLRTKAA